MPSWNAASKLKQQAKTQYLKLTYQAEILLAKLKCHAEADYQSELYQEKLKAEVLLPKQIATKLTWKVKFGCTVPLRSSSTCDIITNHK